MKITSMWIACFLIFALLACDSTKNEPIPPPVNTGKMWNCYQKREWTRQSVNDELIGTWRWIYTVNSWAPDEGLNTERLNTQIIFSDDETLRVVSDGIVQLTSGWFIDEKYDNQFSVETDSSVAYLYGIVLFCGDMLEFHHSYIDGNDNYFVKE